MPAPQQKHVRISKFLSLVLRHQPDRIGIQLDAAGWVDISELLTALQRSGRNVSRALLEQVVDNCPKQRFLIQGHRIRASQGHSVDVDLALEPMLPPKILYHGTAEQNLSAILTTGLQPMSRRQVHLSADQPTAYAVGRRHGTPVILTVLAGAMSAEGYQFQQADNGVWLTDTVPPQFLERPADDGFLRT